MTITTAAAAAESLQSCPTLCDPIDSSPPGSAVPGILQARGLECYHWAFLLMQMVKNPPAVQETHVPSLGQEDSLERGMATHSSVLAWEVPWTEESDGLQSAGLQRVRHCKASQTFTFIISSIAREQQVLETATGKCRWNVSVGGHGRWGGRNGSKGTHAEELWARPRGRLRSPQAQPGHFPAPPEGVKIELWSGELSVLTISQTPGAS